MEDLGSEDERRLGLGFCSEGEEGEMVTGLGGRRNDG